MRAASEFERLFGDQPEGLWTAPGRVNLMGEHTDYNGGLVLPFAIPQVTVAAMRLRSTPRLRVVSLQTGGMVDTDVTALTPGSPSGWGAYPAGVVWALVREHPGTVIGADIVIDGDVPLGSGLASSASIESVSVLGLAELAGIDITREEMAHIAQRAENDFVGAPVGLMDQMASLRCRAGHALLFDVGNGTIEHVAMDTGQAGLSLAVIDTRVTHAHAGGEYRERRATCESVAVELGVAALGEFCIGDLEGIRSRIADDVRWRRTRHIVTENERVRRSVAALRRSDWGGLGGLLTESHLSMRDDFEISCPELDLAVDVAMGHGALGARMTGGGFGGCAIAIVASDAVDDLGEEAGRAFASAGFGKPHVFGVTPAAGARRIG